MPEFSKLVLTWFARHGRKDLPWQENKNPYRIWLSEIMLQQTQVVTVIPYYLRFTSSFPNLNILSKASLDSVLEHWSGLGYYARARNLHKTSIYIKDHYDGHFPLDFDQLIDLPGIGRSTAGAILALSDNQIYPILDGNV
ncbi:MAG: A/G-specific adenine glycosylase, partial [Woeseiaceae bacterium]|nr:A/G-specific adenine glycosylase [Woeseiaceae bacterium]